MRRDKKKLGLTTLKKRRLRGDLIEMNKVISSKESIEWIKTPKSKEKSNFSSIGSIGSVGSILFFDI